MSYDWDFAVFVPYAAALWRALGVTIALSMLSSVCGTLLGFVGGLTLRLPRLSPVVLVANDMCRAVPMLVLMFFFYYFPYQGLLGISAPSPFVAATLALTLAQAAFTADLVRAAIDGVSADSILAGEALGLRKSEILRFIVVPDVARQLLPPMLAFYIGNIKLSSLASVIGCHEIVFVSRVAISQTYRSLEAWILVAVVYIILVVPLGWGARRLEKSEWLKRR